MEIQLNGETREIPESSTLAAFLELGGFAGKRIAVERNGEIVPRSSYTETMLQSGDRLEVVHAIGGG